MIFQANCKLIITLKPANSQRNAIKMIYRISVTIMKMFYGYLRRGRGKILRSENALKLHPSASDEEVKDESLPRTRSTADG